MWVNELEVGRVVCCIGGGLRGGADVRELPGERKLKRGILSEERRKCMCLCSR
jgi:hypothetical protein